MMQMKKSSVGQADWAFDGVTAIVTGAAGGMGGRCAERLLEAGAFVVAHDLNEEQLRETSAHWAAEAHRLEFGDLCDPTVVNALFSAAATSPGTLGALIHAAGIMETRPFLELDDATWKRMIDVNLNASFSLVRSAGVAMTETLGGSIVLFSSAAGRSGRPAAAHYAASKAALLSLTKSAAYALAPNVRVNAICPGVVLTTMWDGIVRERDSTYGNGAGDAYLGEVLARSCLHRAGGCDEIADVVLFLASNASSYVTGQALNVDGGLEMD